MSDYIVAPFIGWFLAQFIKFVAASLKSRRITLRWLWKSGGLPSSHSSIMSSLTTTIFVVEGAESSVFALSLILTLIVLYDAIGVRRAAGINSQAIMAIKDSKQRLPADFKVVLGHKPSEMINGVLLGVVVGINVANNATTNLSQNFLLALLVTTILAQTYLSYKFYKKLPVMFDEQVAKKVEE